MALIDDEVAIFRHAILDDALVDQALDHGHVQRAGRLLVSAADAADRLRRQAEECRKPIDPLLQQLAAVHEHERVDSALRDEPGGDDRLAEGGRGRQDSRFMPKHRFRGQRSAQAATRLGTERPARCPGIARRGGRADVEVGEEVLHLLQAAAGQADVLRRGLRRRQ